MFAISEFTENTLSDFCIYGKITLSRLAVLGRLLNERESRSNTSALSYVHLSPNKVCKHILNN
jgi:hypothetical protein